MNINDGDDNSYYYFRMMTKEMITFYILKY